MLISGRISAQKQILSGSEILSTSSDDFTDLEFISPLIKNKRIIFLGESQHGINEFNQLKFRMIKYLHQKHGFDVVVFESGIAACGLTNLVKDSLTGMRMLVHSLMGIWRVKGNCEMMDYIRQNQIDIAGVDPNYGALYLNSDQINIVLNNYSLSKKLSELDSVMLYNFWSIKSKAYLNNDYTKKAYLDSVAIEVSKQYKKIWNEIDALQTLDKIKKTIFRKAIEANLQVLSSSNDLKNPNYYISYHPRDKIMTDNLQFISDTLYTNRKIIVWAHNAHISKIGNPSTWNGGASIGYYLPEKISNESYVIGFYARDGKFGLGYESCNDLNNKKTSFEMVYGKFSSKAYFIESKNIDDRKYVNGIPHKYPSNVKLMYDASIIIRDVTCSKLIKYNKDFLCE